MVNVPSPEEQVAVSAPTPEMAGATTPQPAPTSPAGYKHARKGRRGADASAGASAPGETQSGTASVLPPEMAKVAAPSPTAAICAELVSLQRHRRFCIRTQQRLDRSLEAAMARAMGYRNDLADTERKRVFGRVAAIRRAAATGDQLAPLSEGERQVMREWLGLILHTEQSRAGWDERRGQVELAMRDLARQLPVWDWTKDVRGFGPLGLAVVVGEACGPDAAELGDYRSHQNLAKRLGIGVVAGHRQGSPGKGAAAEDWVREGYNRQRRAEVWVFLDDILRRAQWRNEGGPQGVYGALYARQVAEYEARGWPHAKKAAARYMSKCLLRDLWHAWRRYSAPPAVSTPAPEVVSRAAPQEE